MIGRGTVASFDAHVGLGVIAAANEARYDFHCTAITDGTRQIEPGIDVCYVVGPAGPGRWEAIQVDRI